MLLYRPARALAKACQWISLAYCPPNFGRSPSCTSVTPKVALTGGFDCNDHRLIWDRLDKVHAKHPDMVLLHGGSPTGAELGELSAAMGRGAKRAKNS